MTSQFISYEIYLVSHEKMNEIMIKWMKIISVSYEKTNKQITYLNLHPTNDSKTRKEWR